MKVNSIPHYADYSDYRNLLILGRVTSGKDGNIILTKARAVLAADFPEVNGKIALHLPDENAGGSARRSLPPLCRN